MIVLPRAPMRRGLEDIGDPLTRRECRAPTVEGELAAGSPFFIVHVPLPGELRRRTLHMLAQPCAENPPALCVDVLFKRSVEVAERHRGRPAANERTVRAPHQAPGARDRRRSAS